MKIPRLLFFFVASMNALVPMHAWGQANAKAVTSRQAAWVRVFLRVPVDDKWTVNVEAEDRTSVSPSRQLLLLVPRVTVMRSMGQGWSIGAGGAYIRQSLPNDDQKPVEVVRPEFRPHIDIASAVRLPDWSLQHRYRIEGRFIRKSDGAHLASGYFSSVRVRYRLQAKVPLVSIGLAVDGVTLIAADEVFLNLGREIVRNTFDQNWIYGGVAWKMVDGVELETWLMNAFRQKPSGDKYDSTTLIRLTLNYTLPL